MKKILLLVLVAFFALEVNTVVAQDKLTKKEQRKLDRKERKEEEKELLKEYKEAYYKIVEDFSFLIEANTVNIDNRRTYNVNNDLTFFKIEGDKFLLQTSDLRKMGYNGLGGITIEGRILDYQVKKGEEGKPITVNAKVMSAVLGHSIVNITILSNGQGMARIQDSRGNDITFRGPTYSLEGMTAFEGQTIF